MKNSKKIILALVTLCFGFIGLRPENAFADKISTFGVQISPSSQRTTLDPGATYSNKLAISNVGEESIDFEMVVEPFSVEDITYAPIYSVVNAYTQIANWVTFDNYQTHLEPGEMAEVNYTVNVPQDVPGGGQYAVISAKAKKANEGSEGIQAIASAGTILIARVNGDTRMTGEIKNTNIPLFLLAPPVSATATFQNSGNVDAEARMTLKIEDYFTGSVIYDGSSDPLEKTILPETTREFTVSWANVPRLGVLKVTLNTEFMGDAEVKSRIVIVCPIWFLALLALIILVIVARIAARKREEARTRANSRNSAGSSQKFNI